MKNKMNKKADYYTILRILPTEKNFVVDWEVVEEVYMTWEEAKKHAGKKYNVIRANKRLNHIVVA